MADYQFTPGVPSPRTASVIAYVWQPDITTMTLYVNGVAAGSISSVDSTFELPTGVGKLGSAPGNDEGMVGTIHRVAIYDEVLPPETLIAHANRFLNIITGPTLAVNLSKNTPTLTITQGVTGKHYQVEYQSSLTGGAWQVLADIPALVGTTAEVTDPTAPATQTARYYRVSELP